MSFQLNCLIDYLPFQFSSVESLSPVQLFVTPWTAAHQASQSITNSEFTQTHVHWVSDASQPSHTLSSPSPPALNLSQHQGLFKWVSSLHQVAKVFHLGTHFNHSSIQWLSCVWLFVTPWIAARQPSLSITNYWRSLKFMSIELVMPFLLT